MKNISIVGVDLSKHLMHAAFVTANGTVVKRKKYNCDSFSDFIKELPPKVTVCAEACAGAHHFGRNLEKENFTVKLIPPQYVKPFVQRNKNDFNDAIAITDAASRDNMKFVPVKSEYIQGVQSLHTSRAQIVTIRTQLINCIRGMLSEFGVKIPQSVSSFMQYISKHYNNDERIHLYTRLAVDGLIKILNEINETISKLEQEITKVARSNSAAKRLYTVPGIGQLTATALITVSGNPNVFKNGRAFSASLGLTPRQNTTGDKPKLLRISKKGNVYVRHLLTICARSLIIKANKTTISPITKKGEYKANDKISLWIRKLLAKGVHSNKVCIAIANKLARISYRILIGNEVEFDANLSNGSCLMQ